MKTILTALLFISITVNSQSIADNGQGENKYSPMVNANYGSGDYFAMGGSFENNGKFNYVIDFQGSDEIGMQLTGGWRLGTEMYNITPLIGATQFITRENDYKKGIYFIDRSLTAMVRMQIYIFNVEIIKRDKQQPILSVGLRGNIFK
jgi:hypothetical protein